MKDEEKDDIQLEGEVEFVESDEEGTEQGAREKLKKLKEKIALLEKEKQEYLDGWQRARADYANLQKANDESIKRLKGMIEESVISELIPVLDSFLMAFGNKEAWEKVESTWRTGVEYIYQQLMNMLQSHGVVLYGDIGEAFDPAKHESVGEEKTDEKKKDHTVAKVAQKGILLGSQVLRPARVTIYTSAA